MIYVFVGKGYTEHLNNLNVHERYYITFDKKYMKIYEEEKTLYIKDKREIGRYLLNISDIEFFKDNFLSELDFLKMKRNEKITKLLNT